MGNMKNFRAEDMPNTKKVAYAGKEPSEQAPDGQAQFGAAANRYGTSAANQDAPEAPAVVEGGQDQAQGQGGSDEVPEGTAKEVTDWVGDDADKAQRALDAENSSGDPRSTLVEDLERVIRREEREQEQEQGQA